MTPETRLTHAFVTSHAAEAARALELLPATNAAELLADLPPTATALALAQYVPYAGARVLEALPPGHGGAVLEELPIIVAIGLMRSIAAPVREALLAGLEPARARALQRALTYPEGSAGALADPLVLTVAATGTAAQALERVRREPQRATYYLYVLEAGARLVGVTTLKALLVADPERSIGALCSRPVASLPAAEGLEALLHSPQWRNYHILPVVEPPDRFVGALHLKTVHALAHARQTGGTERLAHSLVQLWELYAMAGLGLMTGVASGLDAMANPAVGNRSASPAAPERPRTGEEGP